MKNHPPRRLSRGPQRPAAKSAPTRPSGKPIDETATDAYRQVQPSGFKDQADSSLGAALSDPDMDDTEGGE